MATSIVETITPQKAQEYLKKSGGNRNISKPVVDSYAMTMKAGKWLLNGEAIVFDLNDVLLNGHHRLHAIIKADVPIQSFVTRGVEHESFTTFDCGRHRTVGQLIGMQGIKHYNVVSSVVQFAYRLKHNLEITDNITATKRIGKTNSDLIDFFNKDREAFVEAGLFAKEIRQKADILEQSLIGGSYYYLTGIGKYNKDFVRGFFEQLCSFDTCMVASIDMLRKRLIQNKTQRTLKTPKGVTFALLIKTWNLYVTGNSVKCLKYTAESEDFPKFILNDK